MAYTGTQVKTMAQRFLVDIDDDAYSADMLSYINEGCRRFASETHCCQAQADMLVIANTIAYTAIASTIGASIAEQVLFVSKVLPQVGDKWTPLHKAPLSEMKSLLATEITTPTRYSLFAESVYFDTEPGVTLSFTASVFCSYVPVDLSAIGGTILIPEEWIQAIVKYVVFCCHIANRSAGLANGAYAEFEAIKQQAARVYMAQLEGIPGAT